MCFLSYLSAVVIKHRDRGKQRKRTEQSLRAHLTAQLGGRESPPTRPHFLPFSIQFYQWGSSFQTWPCRGHCHFDHHRGVKSIPTRPQSPAVGASVLLFFILSFLQLMHFNPLWCQLQRRWVVAVLPLNDPFSEKCTRLEELPGESTVEMVILQSQGPATALRSKAILNLEERRASCPQFHILCPNSSKEIKLPLHHWHFLVSGLTVSEEWKNLEHQRLFRSRYGIKRSIVLELNYAVTVSWIPCSQSGMQFQCVDLNCECMCLISQKLPERNHKYLR